METPHAATCGVFFLVVHHDYFDFLAIILSQREGNVNKKERRDAATTFSMRSSMRTAKKETPHSVLGAIKHAIVHPYGASNREARCFFRSLQKLQQKKRPPKGGLSDLLYGFNLTEGLNYLLPFRVAVFVAASHVISVTPRAVARSLIGRNVLPSTTSGEEEAGIAEPLTLITFAPTVIVMIL